MTTIPPTESPAQRDARHAYERAKKRRDDLCRLHVTCDRLITDLTRLGYATIGASAEVVNVLLENRMSSLGIEDPTEEVCAYIRGDEACCICALSDANCKCAVDDVRTDSSALAERG